VSHVDRPRFFPRPFDQLLNFGLAGHGGSPVLLALILPYYRVLLCLAPPYRRLGFLRTGNDYPRDAAGALTRLIAGRHGHYTHATLLFSHYLQATPLVQAAYAGGLPRAAHGRLPHEGYVSL
jgi:hypothetical protein